MPAPQNNKNAAKPDADKASTWLQVRVKKSDKKAWKEAAKIEGEKLSSVVVDLLNNWSGNH